MILLYLLVGMSFSFSVIFLSAIVPTRNLGTRGASKFNSFIHWKKIDTGYNSNSLKRFHLFFDIFETSFINGRVADEEGVGTPVRQSKPSWNYKVNPVVFTFWCGQIPPDQLCPRLLLCIPATFKEKFSIEPTGGNKPFRITSFLLDEFQKLLGCSPRETLFSQILYRNMFFRPEL